MWCGVFGGSEGRVRAQGFKSRGLGGCLGPGSDHAGQFWGWVGRVLGWFWGVFLWVEGGTGWIYRVMVGAFGVGGSC